MTTVKKTQRGFEYVEGCGVRLLQSSAIGDYEDSVDRPGTSFVWVGDRPLSRAQAAALGAHLMRWVATGSFSEAEASHE